MKSIKKTITLGSIIFTVMTFILISYLKLNYDVRNTNRVEYIFFKGKAIFESDLIFSVYAKNMKMLITTRWKKEGSDRIILGNFFLKNKLGMNRFLNKINEMDKKIIDNQLGEKIYQFNLKDKKFLIIKKEYNTEEFLNIYRAYNFYQSFKGNQLWWSNADELSKFEKNDYKNNLSYCKNLLFEFRYALFEKCWVKRDFKNLTVDQNTELRKNFSRFLRNLFGGYYIDPKKLKIISDLEIAPQEFLQNRTYVESKYFYFDELIKVNNDNHLNFIYYLIKTYYLLIINLYFLFIVFVFLVGKSLKINPK